ncbi:MAG: hypothetical protein VXZ81_06545 [Pseudomonadota bacterium]|nr:hypothetical protein [Pseudomonadota bacterium]
MLEQRSKTIRQAIGLPKMFSPEASAFLASFVGEIKQSGFISGAIKRCQVEGQRSRQLQVDNT